MVLRSDGALISIPHLLGVDGIPGQLRQVDKFQVKGPELSQNAASSWGPPPAPTGATATETTSNHVNIATIARGGQNDPGDVCLDRPRHKHTTPMATFSSSQRPIHFQLKTRNSKFVCAEISKYLPVSTLRTVRVTAECTSPRQHALTACIQDCSCVWHLPVIVKIEKQKASKTLLFTIWIWAVAAAGVSKMVSEFSASTVLCNKCVFINQYTLLFKKMVWSPVVPSRHLFHGFHRFLILIITKTEMASPNQVGSFNKVEAGNFRVVFVVVLFFLPRNKILTDTNKFRLNQNTRKPGWLSAWL